jgi:DNA (cytosine-5)-methyltransferase 1
MVGNAVSVPIAKWLGQRISEPKPYEEGDDRRMEVGERWPDAAYGAPGRPIMVAQAGPWPVAWKRRDLIRELKDPKPLSHRAASGFLSRLVRSSLRAGPAEFRSALGDYVKTTADQGTREQQT